MLSLENEINEWLQRPKRDTSRQTNNLPPVSAAKTNFVDLHELERMLDTSTPQEVHPIDVNEFSKMLEKVENNKPLGDEMVETTSQASRDSITDQEDQQQEAVESDKEAESTESVDDRGALEPTNDHDDEVDVKDDQQNLQCPLQQQNDEAPMTIEKDNSCVDASSPETNTHPLLPSQLISEQSSSIDDDQTLYPRVSSIVLDTIPSPNPEIESQEDLPTH